MGCPSRCTDCVEHSSFWFDVDAQTTQLPGACSRPTSVLPRVRTTALAPDDGPAAASIWVSGDVTKIEEYLMGISRVGYPPFVFQGMRGYEGMTSPRAELSEEESEMS